MTVEATETYSVFVKGAGARIRFALIATFGPEAGGEALAEALAYGWEHWDRIQTMDNPAGYLYRVGQSKARRSLGRSRRIVLPPALPAEESAWVEPGLPEALGRLPVKQRAAVMLTHGYGWTQAEVAELFGVSRTTVQGRVERGLIKLRKALGVQIGS